MKQNQIFGVETIRQRYVNIMGAVFYTGKTADQLEHAVRKGYLKITIARDGSRSYMVDDLDAYMDTDHDRAC